MFLCLSYIIQSYKAFLFIFQFFFLNFPGLDFQGNIEWKWWKQICFSCSWCWGDIFESFSIKYVSCRIFVGLRKFLLFLNYWVISSVTMSGKFCTKFLCLLRWLVLFNFYSSKMVCHLNWLWDIKLTLNSWDKCHWSWCVFLDIGCKIACYYFTESFASTFKCLWF